MGAPHMPTAAGHHPLKSCPRHEATPHDDTLKVLHLLMRLTHPRVHLPLCRLYIVWGQNMGIWGVFHCSTNLLRLTLYIVHASTPCGCTRALAHPPRSEHRRAARLDGPDFV